MTSAGGRGRPNWIPAVLAVAVAVAAVVGLVDRADDAPDPENWNEALEAAGSYRFTMTVETTAEGFATVISMDSLYDTQSDIISMHLRVTGPDGTEVSCHSLQSGEDLLVEVPEGGRAAHGGSRWLRTPFDEAEIWGSFGIQPVTPDAFDHASFRGLRPDGFDEVRGVQTTRYTGVVDYRALFDIEPTTLGVELELPEDAPVNVWIDADGLVRRVNTSVEIPIPESAGSVTSNSTVEFYDFGTDETLELPGADEVADAGQQEAFIACFGPR